MGSYRERINPRTGRKQYKYLYTFISNKKKHSSETGWFDSKAEAASEGEHFCPNFPKKFLSFRNSRIK